MQKQMEATHVQKRQYKKSAGLVYTQINVPAKTRCLLTREEFRERVINSLLGAFRQTLIHRAFIGRATGGIQALPSHKAARGAVPHVRDRLSVRRLRVEGTL